MILGSQTESALRVPLVEMKEIPPLASLGSDLSLRSPRLSVSCELVYLNKPTKHSIERKILRGQRRLHHLGSVCDVTPAGDKREPVVVRRRIVCSSLDLSDRHLLECEGEAFKLTSCMCE